MTTQTIANEVTYETVKAAQDLFLTTELLADMFGEYIGMVARDKFVTDCSEEEMKQIKELLFTFISDQGIVVTDELINNVKELYPSSPLSMILSAEYSEDTTSNPWVWTSLTETLKPERKAGESVPTGYMTKGHTEYYPYASWIQKGYVERKQIKLKKLHINTCNPS